MLLGRCESKLVNAGWFTTKGFPCTVLIYAGDTDFIVRFYVRFFEESRDTELSHDLVT
jgi:hypothetical protein